MKSVDQRVTDRWRMLFLAMEAMVALQIVAGLFFQRQLAAFNPPPIPAGWQPVVHVGEWLLAVACLGSWLFLLIVSPFFLRSLRWVALTGWMLAFGGLVFGGCHWR